jgi:hypothetical protein
MQTIESIATIAKDGTIVVKAPPTVAHGRRRVVVVIDDSDAGPGAQE